MKKVFLSIVLFMACFAANAQNSAMTITNHSMCDYNVRLGASYDIYNCTYETRVLCIAAGATVSAATYWDFADCVTPFVVGPAIPDAPIATTTACTSFPLAGSALPWGSGSTEFIWREALVWPCGVMPTAPGTQTGHPCGVTHLVGDGVCAWVNPPIPVHIWNRNPSTGDVTLDLY